MPNYNYTHGTTTNANRLRLLIGDHRGTNGTSATGWLFSDEEIADVLVMADTGANVNLINAANICLQIRMSREALNAGVAGTTDTTDRPAAIKYAIESLKGIAVLTGGGVFPSVTKRTNVALKDDADLAF